MDRTDYATLYQVPETYQPPGEKELSSDVDYPNLNSLDYQRRALDRSPRIQPFYDALIVNQHGNAILGTNDLLTREWCGSLWGFHSLAAVDIKEEQSCFKLQCDSTLTGLQYVCDNIFIVSFDSGALQLWSSRSDVRNAESYCPFMIGSQSEHETSISSMEIFYENNTKVVTGSTDGMLKIWDIGSADLFSIHTLRNAHSADVTGLAKDPSNSSLFVSSSGDGRCMLWDYKLPRPASRIYSNEEEVFTTVALNDQLAFLGTDNGTILIVDRRNPSSMVKRISVFDRPIRKIIFNGNQFGVIGQTNIVKVFSMPNYEKVYENSESRHYVRDLVWTKPNEFFTSGWDSNVRHHAITTKP